MNTIHELMQRPYTLIHKPASLEIVELGIKVKIENKLDDAFLKLKSEKEEYFQNMLEHNAQHLIPQPLVWKQNLPIHQSFSIKHWILKCGVAAACFTIAALIVLSFARKSLNRSIEKLNEVINPVIQKINRFLNQTGYQLNLFNSIVNDSVEIVKIKYLT